MNRQITALVFWSLLLTAALPALAEGESCGRFCSSESINILAEEIRDGDSYMFARNINIAGTVDGDLIGFGQSFDISGTVKGDLACAGQSLDISGEIQDSLRFWGNTLNLKGRVDGDLLMGGNTVNLLPRAVVTGKLIAAGGSCVVEGIVEDDLYFAGGKATITGTVLGNVNLTVDEIELGPGAQINGDLTYTARKEIDLEHSEIVKGEIIFEQAESEDEDVADEALVTLGDLLWWLWWTFAAMLVGFVTVALCRRSTMALITPVGKEPMLSAMIGFGTFLVVPAASVLAIILIISLPLGVLTLLVFLIAAYLAKIPIAIWIGRRLLGLLGLGSPSPFLALALGILLLYLLFQIPFYIGTLIWLATTWLGLGSLILTVKGYLDNRREA